MKVAELINKLQSMPSDADVETEGCDCTGQACGVRLEPDNTVLITRHFEESDRVRSSLLYPSIRISETDLIEEIEEAEV